MLHVRKQPALSIPMSPTGGADTLTKHVSRCQAALRERLSEALATLCGPWCPESLWIRSAVAHASLNLWSRNMSKCIQIIQCILRQCAPKMGDRDQIGSRALRICGSDAIRCQPLAKAAQWCTAVPRCSKTFQAKFNPISADDRSKFSAFG